MLVIVVSKREKVAKLQKLCGLVGFYLSSFFYFFQVAKSRPSSLRRATSSCRSRLPRSQSRRAPRSSGSSRKPRSSRPWKSLERMSFASRPSNDSNRIKIFKHLFLKPDFYCQNWFFCATCFFGERTNLAITFWWIGLY